MRKIERINSQIKLISLFLLFTSFLLVNYIITSSFDIQTNYWNLLGIFLLCWLIISLLTKKYKIRRYQNWQQILRKGILYNFYLLIMVAVVLILTGKYAISRGQVFGTILLFTLFDIGLISLYFVKNRDDFRFIFYEINITHKKHNYFLIISDIIILLIAIPLASLVQKPTLQSNPFFQEANVIILGTWLLTSLITGKYRTKQYNKSLYYLSPFIKSIILMIMLTALVLFTFHYQENNFINFLDTYFIYGFLSLVLTYLYFINNRDHKPVLKNHLSFPNKNLLYQKNINPDKKTYKLQQQLNRLLDGNINSIDQVWLIIKKLFYATDIKSTEIFTENSNNYQTLNNVERLSQYIYFNLNIINDFNDLNYYYSKLYSKLKNGGYYFGMVRTYKCEKNLIFEKYPRWLAYFVYSGHLLRRTLLPTIPIIKDIYNLFPKNDYQHISKAEALGKLAYNGFSIIEDYRIGNQVFFIARKSKTPSMNPDPSNGFLIKLKRIGVDNQPIDLYKFRTMYPYSEYIQDYVYRKNKLSADGKPNHDFRITGPGKWLRKLWLDELPQIINYLQGDIKIFGVRALSQHYFKLYPKKIQKMRTQFKNGIIPPYYADMPQSFHEIIKSEEIYLQRKEKQPLLTDIIYFGKVFNNIVLKGARSR